MDQQQLIYFLEVCSLRSFSKAAKSLYISQQGLSKSIKALEEELQTTLFTRLPTGIELTHSAEVLRKQAASLLQHHEQIKRQMQDLGTGTSHRLTIGYAAGCFDLLPSGFLPDYMRRNPDVDVVLRSFDAEHYRNAILNFGMDVSLCPVSYDCNLFESLFTFQRKLVLAMAADHPLARNERVSLTELHHVKTGFLNTTQEPGCGFSYLLQKHRIEPSILLSPSETRLLGELACFGGVVFFYAGRTDTMPDNLVTREIADLEVYWQYHFLVSKNAYVSRTAQDFIAYAQERLQE